MFLSQADYRVSVFHGLGEDAVQFGHGDRLCQMRSETRGFAPGDIFGLIMAAQRDRADWTFACGEIFQ
jgi:hypothetical protein